MTESEGEGDWESLLDSGQLEANIKKLTSHMNSISAFLLLFHSASSFDAGGYLSHPNSKVISKSFDER